MTGNISVEDLFYAGTTVLMYGGFSDWGDYVPKVRAVSPEGRFEPILPPGFDGGKGSHFPGGPSFNFTSLRKADKGRIKELLEVANWFAAPLGTSEYLFRKYGVPDVDYTLDGTDPVLTARGKRETTVPTLYVTDSPFTIYWPKEPDVVRAWYEYQKRAVPIVLKSPTVGLYSETDGTAGERLSDLVQTARQDIYRGKEPLSSWDDVVDQWRKDGGDAIRKEYEKSFERAGQ